MTQPASATTRVEDKVKAATAWVYFASVALLAVLNAVSVNVTLLASWPDWLETLALPVIPAGAAFVAGYLTRHTPR